MLNDRQNITQQRQPQPTQLPQRANRGQNPLQGIDIIKLLQILAQLQAGQGQNQDPRREMRRRTGEIGRTMGQNQGRTGQIQEQNPELIRALMQNMR